MTRANSIPDPAVEVGIFLEEIAVRSVADVLSDAVRDLNAYRLAHDKVLSLAREQHPRSTERFELLMVKAIAARSEHRYEDAIRLVRETQTEFEQLVHRFEPTPPPSFLNAERPGAESFSTAALRELLQPMLVQRLNLLGIHHQRRDFLAILEELVRAVGQRGPLRDTAGVRRAFDLETSDFGMHQKLTKIVSVGTTTRRDSSDVEATVARLEAYLNDSESFGLPLGPPGLQEARDLTVLARERLRQDEVAMARTIAKLAWDKTTSLVHEAIRAAQLLDNEVDRSKDKDDVGRRLPKCWYERYE